MKKLNPGIIAIIVIAVMVFFPTLIFYIIGGGMLMGTIGIFALPVLFVLWLIYWVVNKMFRAK